MTATIDAIHASELLGSRKFFNQMSSHRQKQGSQQAAAHRRANDHHTPWVVPIATGDTVGQADTLIAHVRYPSHHWLPVSVLKQGSESYLSNGVFPILVSDTQRGVWVVCDPSGSAMGSVDVPACISRARDDLSWLSKVEPPSASIASRILSDIEALRDGWDGPDSLAPSVAAKKTANSVIAQAAPYLSGAEIEVDPTVGNPGFHWFSDDQKSVVSLTIQDRGGVVIVASSTDGKSHRVSLNEAELDKVGRALVDAGVGRLNDALR